MNNEFLVFDHVTKRFGALTAVDDVSLSITKGGTTAAGMVKLANPQFKRIVAATLAAAAKRSQELA